MATRGDAKVARRQPAAVAPSRAPASDDERQSFLEGAPSSPGRRRPHALAALRRPAAAVCGAAARAAARAAGLAVGAAFVVALAHFAHESLHPDLPVAAVKSAGASGLELGCRPFFAAGFNLETLNFAAAARAGRRLAPGEPSGRRRVRDVFEAAAAAGFNVVRTWAHTADSRREWPLQISLGVYNEGVFRGLDYALFQAGRAGVRVILSLADNWSLYGGADEYVDWSDTAPPRDPGRPRREPFGADGAPARRGGNGTAADAAAEAYDAARHALFFSDAGARRLYKAHLRAVLNRRNVFTGRRYGSDATLLAVDLLNEPRCAEDVVPGCAAAVARWTAEMAAAAAAAAPAVLVTVGGEGFWGGGAPEAAANPGGAAGWAARVGQNFSALHALPGVSLAAAHTWEEAWAPPGGAPLPAGFAAGWLAAHEAAAAALGRPLLLEEFNRRRGAGGSTAARDRLFADVFAAVEASAARRGALAGSLFWRAAWHVYPGASPDPHDVAPGDAAYELAVRHAARLRALAAAAAPRPGCAEAGAECWVPAARAGGLLARCARAPRVCAGAEAPPLGGVHLSRAECCRTFRRGCAVPW